MPETKSAQQEHLDEMIRFATAEPGVGDAVAAYEAAERVYFAALSASPVPLVNSSYAATTAPLR